MSREIKFRAWNGEKWWGAFTLADIYEAGSQSQLDAYWGTDDNNLPEFSGMIMVQYTGLKDKNGKEIYEGDIVKNRWGKPWTVEFITDKGSWRLVDTVDNSYSILLSKACIKNDAIEVIGNIYENPELLQ